MKWYKRLGALLLAAVLIVGLWQVPGKEAEAAEKYRISSIKLKDNTRTFTGDKGNTIVLADKDPIVIDTKNDIIKIYYKSVSNWPTDEQGYETFDIGKYLDITITPEVTETFRSCSIITDPSEVVGGTFELHGKPTGSWTEQVIYYDDLEEENLIALPESERGEEKPEFDGTYPKITSFAIKEGASIKGVPIVNASVEQGELTEEQLSQTEIDAGTINIELQRNLETTDGVAQVIMSEDMYSVTVGCPSNYNTASIGNKRLEWKPNTKATYLNLEAVKADGTNQTFRYKVNLNIAGYLYMQGDKPAFVSFSGGLPIGVDVSCNEEADTLTLTTSQYLSKLSKLDIMPYYVAGAFCTDVKGGVLNGEPDPEDTKENGSITPTDLNKGLKFTVKNAMGSTKEYTIQVKTPWALQWAQQFEPRISKILMDGQEQKKDLVVTDTWGVPTLNAGTTVEVQLTPEKGKVLDSVVLKTSEGKQLENVTCKNGSFSFTMPSDVVILDSLNWKNGSYHSVKISAKDTDGKDIDSTYCTATMKVGDAEDTMAAAGDTVTLTARTKTHPYYEYQLEHWEYNAEVLKDAQADKEAGTLTFTMPDQEVAITPVYKKVGTQMTFGIKEPDGGSFRGFYGDGYYLQVDKTNPSYTDIYKPGARIQLSLTVNSTGYRFVGWTDGQGNTWGQDAANWSGNNATLTIGSTPQTWIAEFEAKQFASVTLKSENDQMGTVTGTYQDKEGTYFDTVFDGDEITLKAAPKKGYLFDKWEVAGAEVTMPEGADAETTFTMPKTGQDLTITAVFKEDPGYKSDACEITNVELLDSDGKVVRAMTGKEGLTLTIALTKTDMTPEDAEGLAQSGKYYLRITHSAGATVKHNTFDDATNTIPGLAWNNGKVNCPINANDSEEFIVTAEDGTKMTYTIKITYESEKPVISDIQVDRTTADEAKVTFTSDTKGNYYWLYQKASAEEPTQDQVLKSSLKGSIGAGSSQTINLKDLSDTAYKVYLVVKGNMNGSMPSDVVEIDVPKLGSYKIGNACSTSGGTVTIDKKRADAGEKITVTVTANAGMKLDSLVYTKDNAPGMAPVSILDGKVSDGVYTFEMPTADITVGCTWSKASETDGPIISAFQINGVSGTISQTAGTIKITLPYGTDLTSLKPEITVKNAKSVSPASGAAVNLTAPVTYTVTAEDGTTKTYTVTATVADKSLSDKLWEDVLNQTGGSTDSSGKNTWWNKARDMKKNNNYPTYW